MKSAVKAVDPGVRLMNEPWRPTRRSYVWGLGYTQDEAKFPYLVAMHSGYFSARQYLTFTGAKSGEKVWRSLKRSWGKVMPRPVWCSETVVSITCFRASSIELLDGNIRTTMNIYTKTVSLALREANSKVVRMILPERKTA